MTIAAFAVLGAALLIVAGALVIVSSRRAAAPVRRGHRVTVHTVRPDDQTIHGVLVAEYADRLELEAAEYVTAQGAEPIPGATVAIHPSRVSWIEDYGVVAKAAD